METGTRQRLGGIEAGGWVRGILRVEIEAGLQGQRLGGAEARVASAQARRVTSLESCPPRVKLPQEGAGGGLGH